MKRKLNLEKLKLDLLWYLSLNNSNFGININIRSLCDYLVEAILLDLMNGGQFSSQKQNKKNPQKHKVNSQLSKDLSGQD